MVLCLVAAMLCGMWPSDGVRAQPLLAPANGDQPPTAPLAPLLENVPAEVAPVAERCRELAVQREQTQAELAQVRADLEATRRTIQAQQEQFDQIQTQERAVGLTVALGLLLRKQAESLPDLRGLRRASRERQKRISTTQLRLVEWQEQRNGRQDLRAWKIQEQRRLGIVATPRGDSPAEQSLDLLLEVERDLLDALLVDYNQLFLDLVELDTAEQSLIASTAHYDRYIRQRVSWIRNTGPITSADVPQIAASLHWLLAPQHWAQVGSALRADAREYPLPPLQLALGLLLALRYRGRLLRSIRQAGTEAERGACADFTPTLKTLCGTVLWSLIGPGVLAYVGWRLSLAPDTGPLVRPLASGLLAGAWLYLPLQLWRQVSRGGGLAESHFSCPRPALEVVRRQLRWFTPASVSLAVLATLLISQGHVRWGDPLGRIAFLVLMVLSALFLRGLLRPSGPVVASWQLRPGGWLEQLSFLWYALAVAAPLVLAGAAAVGYFYAAGELAVGLESTAFLVLGLALFQALGFRWLLVNHRRIAVEQARQRLLAAPREPGQDETSVPVAVPDEVDLSAVNQQMHRLLRSAVLFVGLVGAGGIWADTLPALAMLDKVTLWHTAVNVSADETPATRTVPSETVARYQPVTLRHLLLAGLIAAMTVAATRNLPGLLEIAVLQRLPLDAALRFAITTVARYALILLGALLVFRTCGIRWDNVQWLLAAITVGLGFGLQEIFANFVSGLIILFERPLRAGDVVTIGDVTGRVVQVRMRATTIMDWDRKELIVPNKEFITSRLLNWTLTDEVTRIVISVGIAYNSDPTRAHAVILQAARSHPLILADPAPSVTFDGFGDSTLHFVLRAFLPNLENRLAVIHDLHCALHQRLREAGIEIAFPQRDVRVRTIEAPLSVIQRDAERPAGGAAPAGRERSESGGERDRG